MEYNWSGVRIGKLSDSNYHAWKQKALLVLTLKDLGRYLIEDSPGQEDDQMS